MANVEQAPRHQFNELGLRLGDSRCAAQLVEDRLTSRDVAAGRD